MVRRHVSDGDGKAASDSGRATDGAPLTAWLLLPPDYVAGTRVPVVTVVYPGSMYGAAQPSSFSLFRRDFVHPQLFAALGYAVLLPSMPPPKDLAESHSIPQLSSGVLPAIDAVVERGIADSQRIGLAGQSDGCFAVLGLITQTTRFRSAIASAGFSDLVRRFDSPRTPSSVTAFTPVRAKNSIIRASDA